MYIFTPRIMKFNHFRIVVTILAAFAGFFAYLCRLNLSLTIEEMVVRDPSELLAGNETYPQTVDQELKDLAKNLPKYDFEEQTLAGLSSSYWRSQRLQQARSLAKRRSNSSSTKKTKKRGNFSPFAVDQIKFLSVDFDVSNDKSSADQSVTTLKPDETMAHDVQGSPVVSNGDAKQQQQQQADQVEIKQEQPRRQQNLLHWNEKARNDLLGAFFLGYVLFQIPGGWAAERFGAKSMFLVLALGTGVSSLLFPLAAKWSSDGGIGWPYAVRFVMGASQGGLFPAAYVLLCEWLPKTERSSWLPVPSAMGRLGTIVMNLIVPLLMESFGWEMVFYISGSVTLLWGALFLLLGSDSPRTSRLISDKELMYIETRMEPRVGSLVDPAKQELTILSASGFSINESASRRDKKAPINWLKMVTNRPLLIMTLVMFTSEWSNMLLLIKLPGFLGPALGMNLNEIGFWSSVLVGIYCVQYPLSGICASRIEAAQFDSLTSLRIRKLFELAAHLMQALGCLVIAYAQDKTIVIAALCLMMFGRSTVGGGQCLMPPELSKEYPGSVMALANSLANLAGLVGPKTVSWLVEDPTSYYSWQSLWLMSAGIFVGGGVIFCLFAENKPQNFARKPKQQGGNLSGGISQAQLFDPSSPPPPRSTFFDPPSQKQLPPVDEQILKMDAFQRVSSEPKADRAAGGAKPPQDSRPSKRRNVTTKM